MPTEAALEYEVSQKLQKELQRHAGKWVATWEDKVVAVGDSATEVHEATHAEGIDDPVIFHVPQGEGRAYFF